MSKENIVQKLKDAAAAEIKQQTEGKIKEVYKIREEQAYLDEQMKKSKQEGKVPTEDSVKALDESNAKAEELMKDEKVAAAIMEDALMGNDRSLKKELVRDVESFLKKYLESESLPVLESGVIYEYSDESEEGREAVDTVPPTVNVYFSKERNKIEVEIFYEHKALSELTPTSELLQRHIREIKSGIEEIVSRKMGERLMGTKINHAIDRGKWSMTHFLEVSIKTPNGEIKD